MLRSVLALGVLPLVTPLAAGNWLSNPKVENGQRQLGLLPFGLEEALLPGETKQVHLYEARFIQLFADAASKHDSCVGQLLFVPNQGAVATTTLLEVEEYRKEEFGVWAQLKCVGRVQLLEIEQTDFEYVLGTVSLVSDEDSSSAAVKAEELTQLHTSVVELQRKVGGKKEDEAATDDDDGDARGGRVEWGHELRDAEASFATPLSELVETRREVLLSRGPDATPFATLHEPLASVWDVEDEATAEATLLSFAACATLSISDRARALAMTSVAERCTLALEALQQQQARLAAMAALQSAGGGLE